MFQAKLKRKEETGGADLRSSECRDDLNTVVRLLRWSEFLETDLNTYLWPCGNYENIHGRSELIHSVLIETMQHCEHCLVWYFVLGTRLCFFHTQPRVNQCCTFSASLTALNFGFQFEASSIFKYITCFLSILVGCTVVWWRHPSYLWRQWLLLFCFLLTCYRSSHTPTS